MNISITEVILDDLPQPTMVNCSVSVSFSGHDVTWKLCTNSSKDFADITRNLNYVTGSELLITLQDSSGNFKRIINSSLSRGITVNYDCDLTNDEFIEIVVEIPCAGISYQDN